MTTIRPEGLRDGFVETRLGQIHYVSAGSGPSLFLIHGGHGGWVHWYANLLPLAQCHTVFALDMPGYGQSADVIERSRLDDLAESAWEAIAAILATIHGPMRDQAVHIAAFSFGSLVATKIALRESEAVRSLLLVNPPGLGEVSQEVLSIQARASAAARTHGLRSGLEIGLRELMLCQPLKADAHALDLIESCVRNTRVVSRSLSRATRLIPMLKDLRIPVHVVLGENDPHQRHELASRCADLEKILGTSSVSVLADAAHWLQYDQSERFNVLALSFFDNANQERMLVMRPGKQ